MQLTVIRQQTPTPRPARDVFDILPVWLDTPELAFSSWLQRQELRPRSKAVYKAMFGKFCAWLKERGLRMDTVSPDQLRRFLDREKITKHHRYRYIRLIERAFDHMGTLGYRGINPGRRAAQSNFGAGSNDPSRFLGQDEIAALVALVRERMSQTSQDEQGEESAWTDVRDAAIVATLLGGGLKVGQALAVTVNCIDMPEGWISLRTSGRDRPHRARLLPFAREALAIWLELRRKLNLPGDLLFPALRRPRGFQPRKATWRMHESGVYRAANSLMSEAGIVGSRSCAQTLRNAYAGQLIEGGADDDLLTEYLGFFKTLSSSRMRAAYQDWKRLNPACPE